MRSVLSQTFDFGYGAITESKHLAWLDVVAWPQIKKQSAMPRVAKKGGFVADDPLLDVYSIVVIEQCFLQETVLPKILKQVELAAASIIPRETFASAPLLHCVFDGVFWVARSGGAGGIKMQWKDPSFGGKSGLAAVRSVFPMLHEHVCEMARDGALDWVASS